MGGRQLLSSAESCSWLSGRTTRGWRGGRRGAGPDRGSRRCPHRPLSQLALPQVLGLILNLPSPVSLGLLSLPLRRRHWVALRQVDGVYYNLDSKLRAPEALGDEDGVR